MSAKKLTVRVQCAEGTVRVEALSSEPVSAVCERARAALQLPAGAGLTLQRERARRDPLPPDAALADLGLRHGDMLYLHSDQPPNTVAATAADTQQPSGSAEPDKASPTAAGAPPGGGGGGAVTEDEVDLLLYQMSGNIERQRDDKLCRHGALGRCVHCAPLEPWSEEVLRAHNIKHMSFHAFLRRSAGARAAPAPLGEPSCRVRAGCTEHPPWPRGICSACQPGALTLNRQRYRHVDNVLLEHAAPVERFLAYWRATGHQRIGYLYGRYEPHPDVPLGIRARVAAIYEPAQTSSRDHIALQPDAKEPVLEELADRLGLRRVGWIFTDLLPDDVATGTVKHIRGGDTHFLSAQECITAGHFQNQHPNPCRHASSGYFGSKFVTVCLTGDSSQQVHMEGYQVSGQCQALVRDGVLLPTRDAPDLGYIRDSSDKQYVPDVFYKERDAYGNEVGVSAKRLPVAYLLVDVPCGVAAGGAGAGVGAAAGVGAGGAGQECTFTPSAAFPPAHRALQQHVQSPRALHRHLSASESFLSAASDLHTLLYLATNEALPLPLEELEPLLRAVRARDGPAAERWRRRALPATLEQLARAADSDHEYVHAPGGGGGGGGLRSSSSGSAGGGGGGAEGAGAGGVWTCPLCTFHNAARRDACEMCAMPRNSAM